MSGFIIRSPDKIRILVPYNPDFVSELKALVPSWRRSYDPVTKAWTVRGETYGEDTQELVEETFGEIEYCDDQAAVNEAVETALRTHRCPKPEAASPHGTDECLRRVCHLHQEHASLFVLPGAPWSVIQAAYRAIALLVHPDKGGKHERMVEVNRAYQTLEERQRVKV
jgi:hypothetical protein